MIHNQWESVTPTRTPTPTSITIISYTHVPSVHNAGPWELCWTLFLFPHLFTGWLFCVAVDSHPFSVGANNQLLLFPEKNEFSLLTLSTCTQKLGSEGLNLMPYGFVYTNFNLNFLAFFRPLPQARVEVFIPQLGQDPWFPNSTKSFRTSVLFFSDKFVQVHRILAWWHGPGQPVDVGALVSFFDVTLMASTWGRLPGPGPDHWPQHDTVMNQCTVCTVPLCTVKMIDWVLHSLF